MRNIHSAFAPSIVKGKFSFIKQKYFLHKMKNQNNDKYTQQTPSFSSCVNDFVKEAGLFPVYITTTIPHL